MFHRDTCRMCHSPDLALALDLGATPLADAYTPDRNQEQPLLPLRLYLCRGCGHHQLLDVIDSEDIYVDYLYESTMSLGLADHFRQYASDIVDTYNIEQGSLAVDVGSNDGLLLQGFKARGLEALGVDPARDIAEKASVAGLETVAAFFTAEKATELVATYGKAHVVTTNNLLANIDDIDDFIAGVKTLLDDTGIYVVEFAYVLDLIDNNIFDYIYHEHLSYFSIKPLLALCRRHGLELVNVERVATKGGSLRCVFQEAGGSRIINRSAIAHFVALEEKGAIHSLATFARFRQTIEAARERCMELVEGLRRDGRRVAGYGASATSTTLMYYFALTPHLEFIADDCATRQGLYSPGAHLPIKSREALTEEGIDAAVILAWRYVEPIALNNAAFLNSGGRFVVPLPSLSVVEGPV